MEKPHKNLRVWREAMELVTDVYAATRRFPTYERFGLAGQMQRSAVSIPSNIAEGAARKGRKEYARFLYQARGSLSELDTQLEIAGHLAYLEPAELERIQARLDGVGRMLNGLIASIVVRQ